MLGLPDLMPLHDGFSIEVSVLSYNEGPVQKTYLLFKHKPGPSFSNIFCSVPRYDSSSLVRMIGFLRLFLKRPGGAMTLNLLELSSHLTLPLPY